jgi:hypothetical protein
MSQHRGFFGFEMICDIYNEIRFKNGVLHVEQQMRGSPGLLKLAMGILGFNFYESA